VQKVAVRNQKNLIGEVPIVLNNPRVTGPLIHVLCVQKVAVRNQKNLIGEVPNVLQNPQGTVPLNHILNQEQ
jgi:hypothetical protein